MLERLTKLWMPVGKRVIVIGSKIHGCELAEFLTKRGRVVTIVDTDEALGEGMTGDDKFQLFQWFDQKGVSSILATKYDEIIKKGLKIINREENEQVLEADTIITALPLMPNTDMLTEIKENVSEIYTIGDYREPKLMVDAIADGARIGNSI
jgi:2,4-dienoyl-CoA reductase (NADPH2)